MILSVCHKRVTGVAGCDGAPRHPTTPAGCVAAAQRHCPAFDRTARHGLFELKPPFHSRGVRVRVPPRAPLAGVLRLEICCDRKVAERTVTDFARPLRHLSTDTRCWALQTSRSPGANPTNNPSTPHGNTESFGAMQRAVCSGAYSFLLQHVKNLCARSGLVERCCSVVRAQRTASTTGVSAQSRQP